MKINFSNFKKDVPKKAPRNFQEDLIQVIADRVETPTGKNFLQAADRIGLVLPGPAKMEFMRETAEEIDASTFLKKYLGFYARINRTRRAALDGLPTGGKYGN